MNPRAVCGFAGRPITRTPFGNSTINCLNRVPLKNVIAPGRLDGDIQGPAMLLHLEHQLLTLPFARREETPASAAARSPAAADAATW